MQFHLGSLKTHIQLLTEKKKGIKNIHNFVIQESHC